VLSQKYKLQNGVLCGMYMPRICTGYVYYC